MAGPTRIDEHIVLSRGELLALLRGKTLRWQGKPSNGSTLFTATMTVQLASEMRSTERAKAIDALTSLLLKRHLDGWTVRPDGSAYPVPGSSAWITFIATNADRIFVNDANGVATALRDLSPERQAEVVEGWLVNGVTPACAPGAADVPLRFDTFDEERAKVTAEHGDDKMEEVIDVLDNEGDIR